MTSAALPVIMMRSFAIAVAVSASLTLASLLWPLSKIAFWTSKLFPLAYVHEVRAEVALEHAADLALAEIETKKQLEIAPFNASAWLRIAFIHTQRERDTLDDTAIAALRRSYQLDPFDADVGPWRLRFSLNHWPQIDTADRSNVIQEIAGLWFVGRLRYELRHLPLAIENPAGRLAAELEISTLENTAVHY